jgi:alanine racemase
MDQSLIDVTDVPDVQVGDEVVFYGGGWEFLDLTTTAESIGTIPYELMCAVSARVPRVYRKSSDFQAECS